MFQLLRDTDPQAEIGCLYEWDGIKYLVDTLSLNYYELAPDYNKNPTALTEMSVKYIKEKKPNLVSIIYDNPDHVGHGDGHDSPGYYRKLIELDGYVGQIIQAVSDAGMMEETIFIVTSDHGGIDKGHGGKTLEEIETPFIIAGKNIKPGGEFQESMMQFDVASTVLDIFDIEQPQVWTGRSMNQVFN